MPLQFQAKTLTLSRRKQSTNGKLNKSSFGLNHLKTTQCSEFSLLKMTNCLSLWCVSYQYVQEKKCNGNPRAKIKYLTSVVYILTHNGCKKKKNKPGLYFLIRYIWRCPFPCLVRQPCLMDFACKTSSVDGAKLWIIYHDAFKYVECFFFCLFVFSQPFSNTINFLKNISNDIW